MAESYTSRTTDVSANGYPNSSQPSLVPAAATPSNIIRKKLMGYVGFANLPNQVHRKSVRKGFQFTCMVVGACLFASRASATSHSAHRRVGARQEHAYQHPLQHHPLPAQGAAPPLRRALQDRRH
jgi:hypothetical protein